MAHLFSIFFPIAFFSVACIGAGAGALRLFSRKHDEPALTEAVLAFLLGQGILGSLALIPALMGQFTKPVLLAMTIPFACWGLWHLYVIRKAFRVSIHAIERAISNAPQVWQVATVGVACILLANGAASITGIITVDAKAFYLVLPKVVASSHRLVSLTGYESFMSIGLLAEMQLAALFLLGMPGISPRLFCWVTGLAGAVILLAICRNAGLAKRGQLISLVIMATSTAATLLWADGKTDIFAAVYGLGGALYALGSWNEKNRRNSIILAGLFTGFALVAKLTYIVSYLPAIYILLFWKEIPHLWLALRSGGNRLLTLRQHLNEGLLFGAAAFIALLPHLVKNLILLGTIMNAYGDGQWFSAETTRHLVLTYPFVLIFGNYWAQYGNMSPLLLAFLPLALLAPWPTKPWNGPVAAISVAALAGLVAWVTLFPAIPMLRYFLTALLLLVVPAAWAAERWSRRDKILGLAISLATLVVLVIYLRGGQSILPNNALLRYFLVVLLLLIVPSAWVAKRWLRQYRILGHVVSFATLHAVFIATLMVLIISRGLPELSDAFRYLFIEQTEKGLNRDEASSYSVYEAINKTAEPGARVFLISYFRFWLRPDLIQTSSGAHDANVVWNDKYPAKFWQQLYENGFTFLYVEDSASPAIKALDTIPDWVTIQPIYPKSHYGAAYLLIFRNPPGNVRLTTQEVSPGAWNVVPTNQLTALQ